MEISEQIGSFFRERLFRWVAGNHRPLPWKGEKDPYRIWLSEVILQQTRVDQGLPYFGRFLARFPRIEDLAGASEDEVMKLWEGLGYYSRARNMHHTARYIVKERAGKFPDTYEELLQLKGVGAYIAAAIASFAFDRPHAVVDGNVFRVLSRFFGIEEPIDSTKGKKLFASLAGQLIDQARPGDYNQAIMDFGATHCTPVNPRCALCPLSEKCEALRKGATARIPAKSGKITRRERFFQYLLLNHNEKILLRKRTGNDIWRGLYEFPLIELPYMKGDPAPIEESALWKELVGSSPYTISRISKPFRQLLTHQEITVTFWEVDIHIASAENYLGYQMEERKNLSKFAFPKVINWYLQDNSLYLKLL
jgi:A/G-specific adenine glycosylase